MNEETYVIKVLLKRGVWRRFQLSSRHTLHDLHKVILKAYEFDDDHLYAFFMEGTPWKGAAYWSPHNDEGPFTNKIKLGSLDLVTKQKFLYLFDFGDEWRFLVQIEKIIKDGTGVLKPTILETCGESPEQYSDADE